MLQLCLVCVGVIVRGQAPGALWPKFCHPKFMCVLVSAWVLRISFRFRHKEGVKIAATDEETKSEAMAPPLDIDAQAQAILE
jgi:hypothetical protein